MTVPGRLRFLAKLLILREIELSLFWYPKSWAFRAGWNLGILEDNVGLGSADGSLKLEGDKFLKILFLLFAAV